MRLQQTGPTEVRVDAWGPGAAQALADAPGVLGELDDVTGFDPPPGPVRDAYRRSATARLTRTGLVLEALVPAIIEQRVITRTAHDAWRWLLHPATAPRRPVPHRTACACRRPPPAGRRSRPGTTTAPASTPGAPARSRRPRGSPTGSRPPSAPAPPR